MQSPGMVSVMGRDDRFDAHLHNQQLLPHRRTRAHDPQPQLGSSLISNPYSQSHPHYDYSYQPHRSPVPQSPPSPPGEDSIKPSLPSISSLLGMADGEQQAVNHAQQQPQQSPAQPPASAYTQGPEYQSGTVTQSYAPATASKMALPPTPPLGPDPVVEGNHSPSAISPESAMPATPYYLGQSMNNMDPHHQRQGLPPDSMIKRPSVPSSSSVSPYQTSPYSNSPYPPTTASAGPYYAADPTVVSSAGIYTQRPLPSNFPPPVSLPYTTGSTSGNLLQHHHYISASSQAAFPQTQDRYICPTCNKAFSRPSSLRIHSHSHTGEKPFKCSHAGCGKAFSVRSNMKRHERGCHAIASNAVSSSN